MDPTKATPTDKALTAGAVLGLILTLIIGVPLFWVGGYLAFSMFMTRATAMVLISLLVGGIAAVMVIVWVVAYLRQ